MRIIRVFPRRTSATPTDDLVRIDTPPSLFDEADEVHVSVAVSWDKPRAEYLSEQWRTVTSNVQIGGPAYGDPGGEFTPGLYLKRGYVITSRGCPNKCWFCDVPKREGSVRELEVKDGWIVQDSNFLATSRQHQEKVFTMLSRQPEPARFNGGLEAALLTCWHAEQLRRINPKTMWFAYDTPSDRDPLFNAGQILRDFGFTMSSHSMMCYVLIGHKGDTIDRAERRLYDTIKAGFMPQAMLFNRRPETQWRKFQREWANRVIVGSKIKHLRGVA